MNTPLKIIIIEDEPIATAYLKKLLAETGISHKVINELDSVADAMLFFAENPEYDLVFMDIHLGDGNCFEILNTKIIDRPIIFCTTFDNYAVQAFKYNSIDYILKPANLDDVQQALEKFIAMKNNGENDYLQRMNAMLTSLKEPQHKKRFLVKNEDHLELIDAKNIVFFYSEAGQTFLVDRRGKESLVEHTLEKLEEITDPDLFFRISRKASININNIIRVKDHVNNRLLVEMDTDSDFEFVVSRNRVKEFKFWLQGVL